MLKVTWDEGKFAQMTEDNEENKSGEYTQNVNIW